MQSGMSISKKLVCVAVIGALGLAVCGLVSLVTISRIKVNGPVYAEIVRGKDIIADILPPPKYILETYLVVLQLTRATEPGERDALIARCRQLEKDFGDRHAYWSADLPEGRLRESLLVDSTAPAKAFYEVLNREFLPAVEAGDLEKAGALANGSMRTAYEKHRAAIDQTAIVMPQAQAPASTTVVNGV